MSRLESADEIEAIVGANRHATDHLGRAVSAEQRVYVLHSDECRARGIDLRDCEYSIALDRGIDLSIWGDFEDRPVTLAIDAEEGDLLPLITSETPERAAAPDQHDEVDESLDDCAACDAPLAGCRPSAACCDDCTHSGNFARRSAGREESGQRSGECEHGDHGACDGTTPGWPCECSCHESEGQVS